MSSKEGTFLRNAGSFVGLSDHFPGSGILNYSSDREPVIRSVLFWMVLQIDLFGTIMYTYHSPNSQP